MTLYPLRFQPLLRRYVWGGRRLAEVLGKPIGEETCAESWEVADHGDDQSLVAAGPLAGRTLRELVAEHGEELFGRHAGQRQFPLLLKFLDAARALSVQVHPNDEQAARLDPPDRGKTEAWVVIEAQTGSTIYAGLKRGIDRAALERELVRGTCEQVLHRIEPRAGDVIFIPAGTVHALGGSLVVAEIQQSSDTTFRLFDWNRLGADGQPRPLHIDEALAVIDFARGPVDPVEPQATERPHVSRLVTCEQFILERMTLAAPEPVGGDQRFHLLAVIEGAALVDGDPTGRPLAKGDTLLLPAAVGAVTVRPLGSAVLLDSFLP